MRRILLLGEEAMRLIAGSAGGIPIKVPKAETRPTTDRTRQAVFSMLGDIVIGARVLDLYAGSGALGLEALSRGAASAVFVEQHREAAAVIRENLSKTRLQGGEVRQADVARALQSLAGMGARFDLIFADPPYTQRPGDADLAAELIEGDEVRALLSAGGNFVVESRMTKGAAASWSGWLVERDREYGSTRILWLTKQGDVESIESGSL